MIIEKINSELYWVIIAVLFFNIMQRKHYPHVKHKRSATLYIAVLVLLLNMFVALILQFELPQWMVVPALLIVILVGFLLRKKIFIFKFKCVECGVKLDFNNIAYRDDNLCDDCRKKLHPELFTEEELAEPEPEDDTPIDYSSMTDVSQIDWDTWEPVESAVICYIFSEDKVLLINKKTGLGAGMVNAPGGRIEAAETARDAAIRECEEETGIVPENVREVGVLHFQFVDNYSIKGYVFFADAYHGTLIETDEADPFWVPVAEIPYDRMWADDAIWLPKAISGSYITGHFIFDDKVMVSQTVTEQDMKEL